MGTLTPRLGLYAPADQEAGWGGTTAGLDVNPNWDVIDAGRLPIATKTGAYTLTANDDVILANGTFTLTLPTAVGIPGKMYWIKNIGTGVITIDGNGAETIDGTATFVLPTQYEAATIVSDNANWWVL